MAVVGASTSATPETGRSKCEERLRSSEAFLPRRTDHGMGEDFAELVAKGPQGILRGNVVEISPDGALVYVTLNGGTLHMLNPSTGGIVKTYDVKPVEEEWSVECRSGIGFHLSSFRKIAVFAVIDMPPRGSNEKVKSRVIALTHPSGDVLFTSSPIPGRVSGTPLISSDGKFIFITRNTEDGTVGHFTILSVSEFGKVRFTEASDEFKVNGVVKSRAPYGPPGIVHNPSRGMYSGGIGNTNDFIAWADSTDSGRADIGLTRGFQFPVGFGGIDFTVVRTIKLRDVGFTSSNKPVMSKDGLNLYFTGTRSSVRAWNAMDFGGPLSWRADLARKKNDGLQPIFSGATLSNDEKKIFVGSAGATFVALNATGTRGGKLLWNKTTESVVLSEPNISPDDKRVYFIEARGGIVKSYDVRRGSMKWRVDCAFYLPQDANCLEGRGEGSFSISQNGNTIFFGNTLGVVTALGVAMEPTVPPTAAPTTLSPTSTPTHLPTSLQPTSLAPTISPSTLAPTPVITPKPTVSAMPTSTAPTTRPTKNPTIEPTRHPIPAPTEKPTTQKPMSSPSPTAAPTPPEKSLANVLDTSAANPLNAKMCALSVFLCVAAAFFTVV
eukprot:CAMPEP_0113555294 /NCGR_PEP_ID=MMETSP0015_2-20120614/16630_1 /TAXON_ID=2838 /ORGANISM="Odontella" /LENGTH=608 /DNA_ID=CAMNT_0000456541 /DNA_START=364 /DNA_END=2191 /DNA_ORIENTATION=- /assembly_acc=CAM_ASM_000160